MNKTRPWDSPASFTVEAALLMTILLPVLIALLLGGFYLHDRSYLQGTAIELAAMESNLSLYEKRDSLVRQMADRRAKHALLWGREATLTAKAGEETAGAQGDGRFPVPGMAASLLGMKDVALHASWSRSILKPARLIRKLRAAYYLADDLFS